MTQITWRDNALGSVLYGEDGEAIGHVSKRGHDDWTMRVAGAVPDDIEISFKSIQQAQNALERMTGKVAVENECHHNMLVCENCDWQGIQADAFKDFWERYNDCVGGIIPSGDCPDCGAWVYEKNPWSYTAQYRLREYERREAAVKTKADDSNISEIAIRCALDHHLSAYPHDKLPSEIVDLIEAVDSDDADSDDNLVENDIIVWSGAEGHTGASLADEIRAMSAAVQRAIDESLTFAIPTTLVEPSTNNEDERVSHSSKHRVVVSVSGGLVQAVYGDDSAVEVLTVDHDNIEQGDDGVCDEHLIPLDLLKDNETAEAIQKYLEPDSDDLCDTCMRSGVAIARTDEDGNTVCVECDED